jgi:hypothetical protein
MSSELVFVFDKLIKDYREKKDILNNLENNYSHKISENNRLVDINDGLKKIFNQLQNRKKLFQMRYSLSQTDDNQLLELTNRYIILKKNIDIVENQINVVENENMIIKQENSLLFDRLSSNPQFAPMVDMGNQMETISIVLRSMDSPKVQLGEKSTKIPPGPKPIPSIFLRDRVKVLEKEVNYEELRKEREKVLRELQIKEIEEKKKEIEVRKGEIVKEKEKKDVEISEIRKKQIEERKNEYDKIVAEEERRRKEEEERIEREEAERKRIEEERMRIEEERMKIEKERIEREEGERKKKDISNIVKLEKFKYMNYLLDKQNDIAPEGNYNIIMGLNTEETKMYMDNKDNWDDEFRIKFGNQAYIYCVTIEEYNEQFNKIKNKEDLTVAEKIPVVEQQQNAYFKLLKNIFILTTQMVTLWGKNRTFIDLFKLNTSIDEIETIKKKFYEKIKVLHFYQARTTQEKQKNIEKGEAIYRDDYTKVTINDYENIISDLFKKIKCNETTKKTAIKLTKEEKKKIEDSEIAPVGLWSRPALRTKMEPEKEEEKEKEKVKKDDDEYKEKSAEELKEILDGINKQIKEHGDEFNEDVDKLSALAEFLEELIEQKEEGNIKEKEEETGKGKEKEKEITKGEDYNEIIHFRKYNQTDPSTDISKQNFYNLEGTYFLTNGANKSLSSGGGGTNAALTKIDENLFDSNNYEIIYEPHKDNKLQKDPEWNKINMIINSDGQKTINTNSNFQNLLAGSVIRVAVPREDDKIIKTKTGDKSIKKVYHINGINWNNVSEEDKKDRKFIIPLVKAYYSAIIQDVVDTNTRGEIKILHLAQIPGTLFGGGEETYEGMVAAIKDNMDVINEGNMKVILDIEKEKYDEIMEKLNKHETGIKGGYNNTYYQKYIKYKTKYLNLKKN